MPSLSLKADLKGVQEQVARFERALSIEVASALGQIQKLVADDAAQDHPYEDHTYTLTDSIGRGEVSGSFLQGNLRGQVVATAPYASYLDDRDTFYPRADGGVTPPLQFLLPAFHRTEENAYDLLNHALEESIDIAQWSR